MYNFESHSTLEEINIMGTDAFGCVNPAEGRLFFVAMEVKKVLEKMRNLGEKIVCIKHLDFGQRKDAKGESIFVSDITITTDKDFHSCSEPDKYSEETLRLLRILGLKSELEDLMVIERIRNA